MVVQEDTVFVSGMDPEFTEEDIAQHFGAIGVIKVCIILQYFDTFKASSTLCLGLTFNAQVQFEYLAD